MELQLQEREGFNLWHRYYLRSQRGVLSQVHSFREHTGVSKPIYSYNPVADIVIALFMLFEIDKAKVEVRLPKRIEIYTYK